MWWLYLDESGDLGFDFVNKKPSEFFTICILATSSRATNKHFGYAVKKTLKRKVNHRRKNLVAELHAYDTSFAVKKYLYDQLEGHTFGIYALTLNKRRVFDSLATDKPRVYNYVARLVIDAIPFERADGNVLLTVDKSKGSAQREEFNRYITTQLQGRLDPKVSLDIKHEDSAKSPGIQLVDMFAWAIHRKYEQREQSTLRLFEERIRFEERYL